MNILFHTLNWYKGEIFEASVILGFGLLLIVLAVIFWQVGSSPYSQAMVIPLVVAGAIFTLSSGYGLWKNQRLVAQLEQKLPEDEEHFVKAEKKRVEGFQYLYDFTKYLATGFFAIAMLIFFFTENRHWQAAAIAMVILGLSGLVIDYFSKERADVYYQIIMNYENGEQL